MTDWIEHTTDTCPVDPETVVEVRLRGGYVRPADKAGDMDWGSFWVASFRPPLGSPIQHPLDVTHYRIITPAKPPKPEMAEWIEHQPPRTHDGGPCPCPNFLIVETWGQASGAALTLGARYQKTKGEAKLQSWESVKYWRPADAAWECRFERDRLVAYRKKEAGE
jgi:hypothetical protein